MTYLISDKVPESDLNKVTGKIGGLISELGGKAAKEEIWGRRKLAYPIAKQEFATYVTLNFDLPAEKMKEFDRDVRLMTEVVRQLIIVKDLGHEALSLSSEEIAQTEEIENVVGGEKSFEAIEGETDESKDLMAKRDEKAVAAEEEPAQAEATEPVKEAKVEEKEEVETEKPKTEKKTKVIKKEKVEEKKEKTVAEKPVKKTAKKKDSADEAERLSKLNEELDDILKDEL